MKEAATKMEPNVVDVKISPIVRDKTPRLYLCDFGFGIQRYDIGKICITEQISKDGTYEGNGLACEFNFRLVEWTRKVKKFLKEGSV